MPKNQVLEEVLVISFVHGIKSDISDLWPTIIQSIKATPDGQEWLAENTEMAITDLALAYTADQIITIRQLFPESQAKRIETLLLKHWQIESPYKDENSNELAEYLEGNPVTHFGNYYSMGSNIACCIRCRLLYRWMGENFLRVIKVMDGRTIESTFPYLIRQINSILSELSKQSDWSWQKLKYSYDITEMI
jgi:hypothetical protein